ncbi:type I restriction-modification system subunit M [Polyangium aurulentum]|uniref:type I restriction-modification system subunit M n=1 Tax=Polyangium aurulentum TaxID=2567896 RepID=UPI0010ADB09A|nr:class I SAM-dependent DNA methyltransferase [Polyangium aurulentum]UQA58593.1 type I restriction-modification system subunit M [Polyangium aurulentum]
MAARKTKTANGAATNGNGNGAGSIVELTKELWQAAVTLRGSIEPADYKRYVLPIIFLRFLSLRYDKRRQELEHLVFHDRKSDYYGDKKALDDPDEYRSAGAFVIPAEARWENIRKAAQADDIKVKLDKVLELLEKKYPDKLRGLLPPIYAGSNMSADSLRGLINLFSKDVFTLDHGGEDLIGRVYEYFIGEFASSEGKRGGEYFTPASIVKTLVAMLEPTKGVVFDPCCGSGGMFVQSDLFTKHSHQLSFFGQESKDFTYRLCRMNLFIHGLDGNIQLGNSYTDDKHATLKADYVLANPPFNDGSKGENGWGADKIADKDPRLVLGKERMPLSPRNANSMWMLHFLSHLKEGGTAGFVMATGELSNSETSRLEVRKALVEQDYVDCIVQLTGQLFANTQIPCSLWFLSKSRKGGNGFRKRNGEILFIDGRKLGTLIPGSRKQKQLSTEEIERIASTYRQFKRKSNPDEIPGFCKVATVDEIRSYRHALAPGRYVGNAALDAEDESFEERYPRLVASLRSEFADCVRLAAIIDKRLAQVTNGT